MSPKSASHPTARSSTEDIIMKGVSALLMLAAVTTFLAGSHRAAFAHSPARQATEGRIDVYVVGGAFDLVGTSGSDGAVVGDCSWLGAAKSQTGVTCSKRLGKAWEQMWVEFVPEADGEVDIDLQSEWYEKGTGDDVRLVWAHDVRVEGAQIRNGGFEEAAAGAYARLCEQERQRAEAAQGR